MYYLYTFTYKLDCLVKTIITLYFWIKRAAPTKPSHNVKTTQKAWFFSKSTGGRHTKKSPTKSLLEGSWFVVERFNLPSLSLYLSFHVPA